MAYDAAASAVEAHDLDLEARYLRALSLVRLGAEDRALREIASLEQALEGSDVPVDLREDIDALGPRLAKDRAFRNQGPAFAGLAATAARAYEVVAHRYGRYYAAINAATLWLLAGDQRRAGQLARRSSELAGVSPPSYWSAATQAEAALVLGDLSAASTSLKQAALWGQSDLAARATTHRQLRRLCDATGRGRHLLDLLEMPLVVHYCGNISAGSGVDPSAWEQTIIDGVTSALAGRGVALAFGALAAGADVIIAEQMLDHGAELHVVLPFSADEFEAVSVRPSGPEWVGRFRRCLDRSSTCALASDSAYLDDDSVFGFASRIAMGRALNRAQVLGIDAEQFAVSDGRRWSTESGTVHEVARWQRAGGTSHIIATQLPRSSSVDEVLTGDTTSPTGGAGSMCHAIIFADFQGFARLRDEHYLPFINGVLGPMADTVTSFGEAVIYRNSWGDAIQLVVRDVVSAASCALTLQNTVQSLDFETLGLPLDLRLRVAAHVGRLVASADPIRGTPSFWGREMTAGRTDRTAHARRRGVCHRLIRRPGGPGAGPGPRLRLCGQSDHGQELRDHSHVPIEMELSGDSRTAVPVVTGHTSRE